MMIETNEYLQFILGQLPREMRIRLYRKKEDGTLMSRKYNGYTTVTLEVKEIFRVDVKFIVKFHTYELEWDYYITLHKSPRYIENEFREKLQRVVWDTLLKNNEDEYVESRHQAEMDMLGKVIHLEDTDVD